MYGGVDSYYEMVTEAGTRRRIREEEMLYVEELGCVVHLPEMTPDQWQKIGECVRKTAEDMKRLTPHEIDSGRVELPSYSDDLPGSTGWGGGASPPSSQISFGGGDGGGKTGKGDTEREKGTPRAEEEHRIRKSYCENFEDDIMDDEAKLSNHATYQKGVAVAVANTSHANRGFTSRDMNMLLIGVVIGVFAMALRIFIA